MRIAIYTRISTKDKGQETENQRAQLVQFSESQGWQITQEYQDHESGGNPDRAQFRRMLQDAGTRKWDLLLFWALDRLTREGTLATLKYLELLESYGIRWRSFTEPWIDSAGPFRDVIISLLASLAKQERIRISERVKAGLERVRTEGKRLGRKPRLIPENRLRELVKQEWSLAEMAQLFGCGRSTVRDRMKALEL